MLIKLLEKIDSALYKSGILKRILSEKALQPRLYYNQISELNKRVELLEAGLDKMMLHFLPKPLGITESLKMLVDKKLSMGRFGDGEFRLMYEPNHSLDFQTYDFELARRLREIFEDYSTNDYNYINGISWGYGGDPYFRSSMIYSFNHVIDNNAVFLDAKITWRTEDEKNINLWRQLFGCKELVIITGKEGHFKFSDELFGASKSIQVVFTSSKDAWSHYESLMDYCKTLNRDSLILCSLGPTATVLCFELAKIGYHALDIGALSNKFYELNKLKGDGSFVSDKIATPPIYIGC